MRAVARRALVLALVASCHSPLEPDATRLAYQIEPTAFTRQGADTALACGAREHLRQRRPVESIELLLVPLATLQTGSGLTAAEVSSGNQIFMAERLRDSWNTWAHGYLHVLFGLPGITVRDSFYWGWATVRETHHIAFFRCGLI